MAGIEEFALGVVASLVASALSSSSGFTALNYIKRKKIENRVENATAEVVEPLLPFLSNEGINELQQRLLFLTCTEELKNFTIDSRPLFSGSLDGQKIFDKLYSDKELPQAITDESLESIYTLLCPRVATLLCRLPAAVQDWEANAWTENFSRLDEVAAELRQLFFRLDADEQRVAKVTSGVLTTARRWLAQRVSMKLDLTGLRSDKPLAGKFSDFFVHPELEQIKDKQQKTKETVGSKQDAAQRFIQRSTRAVIMGAPGSGKSTWTRWLQKELLDSTWPGLALRVELRSLSAASLPSLHNLIRQQLSIHVKEELTPERIREWIGAKQLVLLLDGFDEIAPACRKTVREWIADIAEMLQSCPVLITSRPLTTNHLTKLSKEWLSWEIKPFDEKRIIDYIQRWYAHAELLADSSEKPEPKQLATQLKSDPTIGPLTSNPLLLSTLLMVHHLDGSLPSGRAELYKRYVDGMLGIWDDRRKVAGTDIALLSKEKKRILTELAVHLQTKEKDQLDEDEAIELVRRCLKKMNKQEKPEAVLAVLRERSGLIVGPGVYSFIHKSVAEYLVAEAAVEGTHRDAAGRRIDRFALFEHRNDDRWNVVIFLWAGLAPLIEVEAFIEQCYTTEDIPLRYGILFDQYDRFPSETKRLLILRFLQLNPKVVNANSYWTCSHAANSSEIRLQIEKFDLNLRSLSGEHPLILLFGKSLIDRAVSDHLLLWSDAKATRSALRRLIWMRVALHSPDLQDWASCIKQIPKGLTPSDPDQWLFWLAWRTALKCMEEPAENNYVSYLHLFCQTQPKYRGHLALAITDALVFFPFHNEYSDKIRKHALDFFKIDTWETISSDLLLSSCDWNSGREHIDLFDTALHELQSWCGNPQLDADQLDKAISTLSQLIVRRDELAQDNLINPLSL